MAAINTKKMHKPSTVPAQQLAFDWIPWPGRHTLELLDANHVVFDRVQFEVRGAVERIAESGRKIKDQ
ncbi:MAG: hypothetical protein H7240_04530 [Glaciimonas sp.]|nr:hypothetical protein [Glaciimonas sp.]